MKLDTPIKPDHIRFVCVGCTHGSKLEPARVPPGDVLLVAGDFTTCGLPKEVAHFNKNLGMGFPSVLSLFQLLWDQLSWLGDHIRTCSEV
ncbi:hypothetical protein ANCCAN_30073 [Ancylostoma caninum]|uniref:Calcineurin-like phosphoesterase domain-containing protein n=1 Tax=Ancylostoma caninum TaxID=29170 RepID=A0A368EZW5_ANCCA|nr:hypothetical protein ANCCAN_30073 [Ancylostoma caninum]